MKLRSTLLVFVLTGWFVQACSAGALGGALGGLGEAMQEWAKEGIRQDHQIELERLRNERLQRYEMQRLEQEANERRKAIAEAEARKRATAMEAAAVKVAEEQSRRVLARKQGVTGSGFFVSDRGHIITNAHVLGDYAHVQVRTSASRLYEARVVKIDTTKDLALLVIDYPSKGLKLAHSTQDIKGEDVLAIGYPMPGVQGQESKITNGIVSSLSGMRGVENWMQISAAIQGGNSGGPLINTKGVVVGVVVASINAKRILENSGSLAQNVNYAIKSEEVLDFLRQTTVSNSSKPMQGKASRWADENTVMVMARDTPFSGSFVSMPTSDKALSPAQQLESDLNDIQKSPSPERLRAFISENPAGQISVKARKLLRDLESQRWLVTTPVDSVESYRAYLDDFPKGEYSSRAMARVKSLEDSAWRSVLKSNSSSGLNSFLSRYPDSNKAVEARRKLEGLDEMAWNQALKLDTASAYEDYRAASPNGKYRFDASEKLQQIKAAQRPSQKQTTETPPLMPTVSTQSAPNIVTRKEIGQVSEIYVDLGYIEVVLVGAIVFDKAVFISTYGKGVVQGRVSRTRQDRASVLIPSNISSVNKGDVVVQ